MIEIFVLLGMALAVRPVGSLDRFCKWLAGLIPVRETYWGGKGF